MLAVVPFIGLLVGWFIGQPERSSTRDGQQVSGA
jgi:hypothetical protein